MTARISLALVLLVWLCASPVRAAGDTADYLVSWPSDQRLQMHVAARLPGNGDLEMAQSWPGDSEPVASGGWPALVSALVVKDAGGKTCAVSPSGSDGWRLPNTCRGVLDVEYDVDYSVLQELGWPGHREGAFRDSESLSLIGRSLFVTRASSMPARVSFTLPKGWQVAAPWPRQRSASFRVKSSKDLVDNLIAFSTRPFQRVSTGAFDVQILSLGSWRADRRQITRVVRAAMDRYAASMPIGVRQPYLLVLHPQSDSGGESFRASFAMNRGNGEPTGVWQTRIAHELFHSWNGWRLKGSDYAAVQWFQEGFTEYMANTTLRRAAISSRQSFHQAFATHMANAARLQTPLDTPGSRKGPPLYSAGALVALDWDARIRRSTGSRKTLDDFFQNLWRRSARGKQLYGWPDIRASLYSVAPEQDWDLLHKDYVAGKERFSAEDIARDIDVIDP
jgi:predicted metalloprotease with PDZ domain